MILLLGISLIVCSWTVVSPVEFLFSGFETQRVKQLSVEESVVLSVLSLLVFNLKDFTLFQVSFSRKDPPTNGWNGDWKLNNPDREQTSKPQ